MAFGITIKCHILHPTALQGVKTGCEFSAKNYIYSIQIQNKSSAMVIFSIHTITEVATSMKANVLF